MKLSELHTRKKIAQKLFKKPRKKTPEEEEEEQQDANERRANKLTVDLTQAEIVPDRGPNTNLSHYSNIGGTSG